MGRWRNRLRNVFKAVASAGLFVAVGYVSTGALHGRPLTTGEKETAAQVFGDKVQYDKVQVYNGAPMFVGLFKLGACDAITPDGNIYLVKKESQTEDLSTDPRSRKLLVHEMTHVWQHQQGHNLIVESAGAYLRSHFNYGGAYDYTKEPGKDFRDLNLEQQARMVEDYYALRQDPAQQEKAEALAERLELYFPIRKARLPAQPLPLVDEGGHCGRSRGAESYSSMRNRSPQSLVPTLSRYC